MDAPPNRSFSKRGLIVVLAFILPAVLAIYALSNPRLMPGQAPLTDLQSIETLRAQFNQDAGKTRLILLVSPTGSVCVAGARWVQSEILEKYSSDSLRVYAVWLPMMWSDNREKWDGATMPDPRVRHYWDGDLIAGKWFADELETWRAISWDVYYLYGPDSTWDTIPQALLGFGGDIINQRENLRSKIEPLLRNE